MFRLDIAYLYVNTVTQARKYPSRHPEYTSRHPQHNTKLYISPTHQDHSHLTYTINNINKIVSIYNMKFYKYNYNSKLLYATEFPTKRLKS